VRAKLLLVEIEVEAKLLCVETSGLKIEVEVVGVADEDAGFSGGSLESKSPEIRLSFLSFLSL